MDHTKRVLVFLGFLSSYIRMALLFGLLVVATPTIASTGMGTPVGKNTLLLRAWAPQVRVDGITSEGAAVPLYQGPADLLSLPSFADYPVVQISWTHLEVVVDQGGSLFRWSHLSGTMMIDVDHGLILPDAEGMLLDTWVHRSFGW